MNTKDEIQDKEQRNRPSPPRLPHHENSPHHHNSPHNQNGAHQKAIENTQQLDDFIYEYQLDGLRMSLFRQGIWPNFLLTINRTEAIQIALELCPGSMLKRKKLLYAISQLNALHGRYMDAFPHQTFPHDTFITFPHESCALESQAESSGSSTPPPSPLPTWNLEGNDKNFGVVKDTLTKSGRSVHFAIAYLRGRIEVRPNDMNPIKIGFKVSLKVLSMKDNWTKPVSAFYIGLCHNEWVSGWDPCYKHYPPSFIYALNLTDGSFCYPKRNAKNYCDPLQQKVNSLEIKLIGVCLSFIINGKDMGTAIRMIPGDYKVFVNCAIPGSRIELVTPRYQ
eukprot:265149_1